MFAPATDRDRRQRNDLKTAVGELKEGAPNVSKLAEGTTISTNFKDIHSVAQELENRIRTKAAEAGISGASVEAEIGNRKYAAASVGGIQREADKKDKNNQRAGMDPAVAADRLGVSEENKLEPGLRTPRNLALSSLWGKDPQTDLPSAPGDFRVGGNTTSSQREKIRHDPRANPSTADRDSRHVRGLVGGANQDLSTQSLFEGPGPASRAELQRTLRSGRYAA